MFWTFVFSTTAQNAIGKVSYALRQNKYVEADSIAKYIENKDLKSSFLNQIRYYLKGEKVDTIRFSLSKMMTKKDSMLYYYLSADALTINRISDKNEDIYNKYLRSYDLSKSLKDSTQTIGSLLKLCNHLVNRVREDTLIVRGYLNELKIYCKTKSDLFWYNYYEIRFNGLLKDIKIKLLDTSSAKQFKRNEMNTFFKNMRRYSKQNDFQKAMYYKILSSYQSDWLKDYETANNNMIKAKTLFNNFPFWYAYNRSKGLDYNRALNYYKNKEYHKAIPLLKKDLERDKEKLYIMYTYEYLYLCYKAIGEYGKALSNFEEMHIVKENLDQKRYALAIKEINEKYKKEIVESKLYEEKDKNKRLEKNLMTLAPILGFITLILILIFYLYRRYKKKSAILEDEQSETLQKLDELKSIVIKNHIILKDKTKVYISDLMYVKSDDHYLEVFTQDEKSHVVRGKLSQIKEELPPNFIQCHRSYIVNSNFIKQVNSTSLTLINKEQIPLSRSYKNKF